MNLPPLPPHPKPHPEYLYAIIITTRTYSKAHLFFTILLPYNPFHSRSTETAKTKERVDNFREKKITPYRSTLALSSQPQPTPSLPKSHPRNITRQYKAKKDPLIKIPKEEMIIKINQTIDSHIMLRASDPRVF